MKKIFNFIFLLIVCLVPIVGNAETELKFEWKVEDSYFVGDYNGQYYFYGEDGVLNYLDKNGNNIGTITENIFDYPTEEFFSNDAFRTYFNYDEIDLKHNVEDDVYFFADYYDEEIVILGETPNHDYTEVNFEDDIDLVNRYLGLEYTIYKNLKDTNNTLFSMLVDDGYNIAYYGNNNNEVFVSVYDGINEIFKEAISDNYFVLVSIDNDKIYIIEQESIVKVYDLNATLLETFDMNETLDSLYEDRRYYLYDFHVNNNNVMFFYEHFYEDDNPKGVMSVKDFYTKDIFDRSKTQTVENYVFLKYRIENDMTLVTSKTGGSFTAEKKIDEFDREYVELDIKLADGYIVDSIKVTDINGNEIEVTDNKFYMPGSDVTIQVLYKGGEYLPIPDTGLGKSITLILIGVILISVGLYTVNYVRHE